MSTVSESNSWCAMISAENELGIDSHPFTTASPRFQIALSVFSLTSLSLWRRGLRPPLDSPPNPRRAPAHPRGPLPPPPLAFLANRRGGLARPAHDSSGQVSSGRHTARKLHQRQIRSSSVLSKSAIVAALAAGSTRYAFMERIDRRTCSLMASRRSSFHWT